MTLCTINHKEKTVNGKKYEMDEFTLGTHYTVVRNIIRLEDGSRIVRICVNVSYEDKHENYIPEIYYQDDFYGEYKPEFKIQTTAYGTMNPDEIAKVITGYQEAMQAVEILTKNFC